MSASMFMISIFERRNCLRSKRKMRNLRNNWKSLERLKLSKVSNISSSWLKKSFLRLLKIFIICPPLKTSQVSIIRHLPFKNQLYSKKRWKNTSQHNSNRPINGVLQKNKTSSNTQYAQLAKLYDHLIQ